MVFVFEGHEDESHRFHAFDFHDETNIPGIPAPYLLLAENEGVRSPSTHTVIYAGESADCRQRCAEHKRGLGRFRRDVAVDAGERFDTGVPSLVLIPENWRDFVASSSDARSERVQYEERLKFLFSPICDFQSRHLAAHRGGRRIRPGNHLVSIHPHARRLTHVRPLLGFMPPPSPPESRQRRHADQRHA
jgi:hypothetical protein